MKYTEIINDLNDKINCIWEKIMGKVIINETDFFIDLGGNSIKLLMLINEINKVSKLSLTILDFIEEISLESVKKIVFEKMNTTQIKSHK